MVESAERRIPRLRRLRAENPGWSTAKNNRWNAANLEKRAAHKAVEHALRKGLICRRPCQRCGAAKAQAHHDDYSKPLVIMWLCQMHHRERHRELDAIASMSEAA